MGLKYDPFCFCARVRLMRGLQPLYFFVLTLTSSFALVTTAAADNRLSGFVFASDACQLRPPAEAEACLAALVPISGTVAVRKRGGGPRRIVSLSDTGTFTTKLAAGRYNVRLLHGQSGGLTLQRRDFRITPAIVSIPKTGRPTHNSVYFTVSHRSRRDTPFAGVSDGCEGK
jgi:hypothetical protein